MDKDMNDFINKRFGNEGIAARAHSVNGDDLILISELEREDPVVILYEKDYMLKVAWLREADMSDYQKNRFQFQLYHVIRDFEMRSRNLRHIRNQDGGET